MREGQAADGSTVENGQLSELRQAIRGTVNDPQALQANIDAIDELQNSFVVAYKGLVQSIESTDVFIFLFRVSEESFQL